MLELAYVDQGYYRTLSRRPQQFEHGIQLAVVQVAGGH